MNMRKNVVVLVGVFMVASVSLSGVSVAESDDTDGDSWTDVDEEACGSDSLDPNSIPQDYDGDGICDGTDEDDDNDGVSDEYDAFPLDPSEIDDTDGDFIGDNADPDDDNDGWTDVEEVSCQTDSTSPNDVPDDTDDDGECDATDTDDDEDGVSDEYDAFPLDPSESVDTDGDGIGDNADPDDDGDGWLDAVEEICAQYGGAGDAYDAAVIPSDLDLDGTCDTVDPDDDGDGYPDPACVFSDFGGSPSQLEYVECAVADEDRFPLDPSEWYDGNGDMRGDNAFPPKEELPGFGLLLTLVALTIGAVIRRPLRA